MITTPWNFSVLLFVAFVPPSLSPPLHSSLLLSPIIFPISPLLCVWCVRYAFAWQEDFVASTVPVVRFSGFRSWYSTLIVSGWWWSLYSSGRSVRLTGMRMGKWGKNWCVILFLSAVISVPPHHHLTPYLMHCLLWCIVRWGTSSTQRLNLQKIKIMI